MKHELRIPYYLRYADDFAILDDDEKRLESKIQFISDFLAKKLKLKLHPKKIIINNFTQGIDFLGYICFPHYRLVRTKTKKRMLRKLQERKDEMFEEERTAESFNQTLQSYYGDTTLGSPKEAVQKHLSLNAEEINT